MDRTETNGHAGTVRGGTLTLGERTVDIGITPVLIGRGAGCHLRIEGDKRVSKVHFELIATERGTRLRDMGSKNGTHVWAQLRQDAHVFLTRATTIQIGNTELQFHPGKRERHRTWPAFGVLASLEPQMQLLFERITEVVNIDVPLHITGESGTGKEYLARVIHSASDRANKPFIVVDLSRIPASLIEAEIFGYAEGAFTGAVKARSSPFEDAHGGVVLIDELGHLSLDAQKSLLRVVDAREVLRLGENVPRPVNARIVSASRHDLGRMVNEGKFHEDVYYRLLGMTFELPPLRERRHDIPLLTRQILIDLKRLEVFNAISAEQLHRITEFDWSFGNIRQLRQVLTIALGLRRSPAGLLDIEKALAFNMGGRNATTKTTHERILRALSARGTTLAEMQDEVTRLAFDAAARRTGGNLTAVARELGMTRQGLHLLMKRLELERPAKRAPAPAP